MANEDKYVKAIESRDRRLDVAGAILSLSLFGGYLVYLTPSVFHALAGAIGLREVRFFFFFSFFLFFFFSFFSFSPDWFPRLLFTFCVGHLRLLGLSYSNSRSGYRFPLSPSHGVVTRRRPHFFPCWCSSEGKREKEKPGERKDGCTGLDATESGDSDIVDGVVVYHLLGEFQPGTHHGCDHCPVLSVLSAYKVNYLEITSTDCAVELVSHCGSVSLV